MRGAADPAKTFLLVDAARGVEMALGPEDQFPITDAARKTDADARQPSPQPEAARDWIDDEKPEFGLGFVLSHQEYGTHDDAIPLGDPAALALRIAIAHEVGDDFGNQRLEASILAEFPGVELAVQLHHSAHVPWPGWSELDAGFLHGQC